MNLKKALFGTTLLIVLAASLIGAVVVSEKTFAKHSGDSKQSNEKTCKGTGYAYAYGNGTINIIATNGTAWLSTEEPGQFNITGDAYISYMDATWTSYYNGSYVGYGNAQVSVPYGGYGGLNGYFIEGYISVSGTGTVKVEGEGNISCYKT